MIGLNQYLLQMKDQTLFDLLVLPEAIDKETVVDNILLQGGEFEVVYADPEFMRNAIGMWGRKHYYTFEKWAKAQALEYNPLENYDRIEDWQDTGNRGEETSSRKDSGNTRTFDNQDKRTLDTEDKRTLDTEDKRTLDTQDKRTLDTEDKRTLDTEDKRTLDTQDKETRDTSDETVFDKTTTVENEVSAMDSSTYQPTTKNTTDEDGTVTVNGTGTDTFDHTGTDTLDHTGTDTLDHTGTDTLDHTGTIKDEYGEGTSGQTTENKKDIHTGRIHGNIGTLTSQKMLADEYEVARFNIVEQITDIFLLEFTIPVYD